MSLWSVLLLCAEEGNVFSIMWLPWLHLYCEQQKFGDPLTNILVFAGL